jgi:DNA replication protein DnaC
LLFALGTEAAMAGFQVKYVLATQARQRACRGRRREAADQDHRTRYGRVDLLCIDELGYMELDRSAAELIGVRR